MVWFLAAHCGTLFYQIAFQNSATGHALSGLRTCTHRIRKEPDQLMLNNKEVLKITEECRELSISALLPWEVPVKLDGQLCSTRASCIQGKIVLKLEAWLCWMRCSRERHPESGRLNLDQMREPLRLSRQSYAKISAFVPGRKVFPKLSFLFRGAPMWWRQFYWHEGMYWALGHSLATVVHFLALWHPPFQLLDHLLGKSDLSQHKEALPLTTKGVYPGMGVPPLVQGLLCHLDIKQIYHSYL